MSAQHTPGPWWVSQVYENRVAGNRNDNEGTFVADCDSRGEGAAQDEANTRLIAAAPELLEFVREYAQAWADGMAGDSYLLRKAESVLIKATGSST